MSEYFHDTLIKELTDALRGLYLVVSEDERDYPDKHLYQITMAAIEQTVSVVEKADKYIKTIGLR